MVRDIQIKKGTLVLKDRQVEGFFEREVKPFGTSAKVDIPKKYLGQKVYVVVTRRR